MAPRITEEELLQALAESAAGTGADEAKTTGDITAETGLPYKTVLRALRLIDRSGRLRVHRVLRRAIDAKWCYVQAYTVLEPPKKKRPKRPKR